MRGCGVAVDERTANNTECRREREAVYGPTVIGHCVTWRARGLVEMLPVFFDLRDVMLA